MLGTTDLAGMKYPATSDEVRTAQLLMGDDPALEFLNHSEKPATLSVRYNGKDPNEMVVMPKLDEP